MSTTTATPAPPAPAPTAETFRSRGPWAEAWRRLQRDKLAMIGLAIIAFLVLVALAAPVLAPHDPNVQFKDGLSTFGKPLPPSGKFLLGTDSLGRDTLSRLIYGTQISLLVGVIAVGIATTLGTLFGVMAGYFGGWVDNAIMRFTDVVMSFPSLLLIMAIVAIKGPSLVIIFCAIGLVDWTTTARIVRSQVLALREMEYIEAARAAGASNVTIMWRHILPNTLAPVIVISTMGVAGAIMSEAALSFLGLGVKVPQSSWGSMIHLGRDYFREAPWVPLIPGVAIALTVFAFNVFGDGLRDALDPKLK